MISPLFDIAPLIQQFSHPLDSGYLTLTSNNRLANKISQAWGQHQQQYRQCWEQPAVYHLDVWIEEQWQSFCDKNLWQPLGIPPATPLTTQQSRALWQQVVTQALHRAQNTEKSTGTDSHNGKLDELFLIKPESIATQVHNSYQKVQRWLLQPSDTQQLPPYFQQWITLYKQALHKQRGMTPEDRIHHLTTAFTQQLLTSSTQILLVGFNTLPPLLRELLTAASHQLMVLNPTNQTISPLAPSDICGLIQASPSVDVDVDVDTAPTKAVKLPCQDIQQELLYATQWAAHLAACHPEQRVGLVIPNLQSVRKPLKRLLSKALETQFLKTQQLKSQNLKPENLKPQNLKPQPQGGEKLEEVAEIQAQVQARVNAPSNYNISIGEPLTETPIVASALLLLSLNQQQLPTANYYRILNSPFWGFEDMELRARLDDKLQQLARHALPVARFFGVVKHLSQSNGLRGASHDSHSDVDHYHADNDTPTNSYQSLLAFEQLTTADNGSAKRTFSAWLGVFLEQLTALGWPGYRSSSSHEHQQYQQWQALWSQFKSLDRLSMTITRTEALTQLQRLSSEAVFQPKTKDAGIQVLGLLESANLRFDKLWVASLNADQWPQPTAIDPLIPLDIQRQYHMPRCHPATELKLAEQQVSALQQAADEVIFSYSLAEDDQERLPSVLIGHLPEISSNEVFINGQSVLENITSDYLPMEPLESVDCSKAPPVNLATEMITGGTKILENQAICPFNAFAIHRLGAKIPQQPSTGLSAMERGILVHKALELIWKQLHDQQQLISMDERERFELLETIVETTLSDNKHLYHELYNIIFFNIEKQRIKEIINKLLELEISRSPFVVLKHEHSITTSFHGIPITMRADRIDELSDGSCLIIDYKTGANLTMDWEKSPITNPQLPLYMLNYPASDTVPDKAPNTTSNTVSGIAFAQVTAKKQLFKGILDRDDVLPGVKSSTKEMDANQRWNALKTHCEDSLNITAAQFLEGDTRCEYTNAQSQIAHSALEPLNRVAEQYEQSPSTYATQQGTSGEPQPLSEDH